MWMVCRSREDDRCAKGRLSFWHSSVASLRMEPRRTISKWEGYWGDRRGYVPFLDGNLDEEVRCRQERWLLPPVVSK